MNCWFCGKELELTSNKISFREMCDKCSAWLHCCKNCKHYHPGLPNDCEIPGTDFVPDREKMNFCEDFSLLGKPPEKKADPKDVMRRLFGDD